MRSPAALDGWALRRLLSDVFGQQPARAFPLTASTNVSSEMRGVWLPEQGEGGWMPLPTGLLKAGVPAAATEPAQLA